MSEQISSKKAFEDLGVIKDTIDRTTGGKILRQFIYSMSSLMILTGILITIACSVNYYLITAYGATKEIKRAMIIMWIAVVFLLGFKKMYEFYRICKVHGMSFFQYYKKVVNKSFLMIDIPIEVMGILYMIFFIKIGHPEYILTSSPMWIGVLLTLLGAAFFEKGFTTAGYVYIVSSGIGLLFMNDKLLLFTAITYGVISLIMGFLMHRKYIQYSKQHCDNNQGQRING
ncbi:MAG: hypothetical protein PVI26_08980 [Chitinispirillia bacterium]|jgi:hypothetical protein